MKVISQELERQAFHPAMHQKILLRAAELVEQGWTHGTAARAAEDPKVCAYITVDAEGALARARALEKEAPRGPRHGVPLAYRDRS